jgi:putative membrane protein
MKKVSWYAIALAATMFVTSCTSNSEKDAKESAEDMNEERFKTEKMEDASEFMVEAASSHLGTVEAAKVIEQKAGNKSLRDMASMLVKDHQGAYDEIVKLAKDKGIVIPGQVDEKSQSEVNDLTKKDAKGFDKDAIGWLVSHHEAAIKLYKDDLDELKDADARTHVTATLPVMEKHLQEAKQLEDNMN